MPAITHSLFLETLEKPYRWMRSINHGIVALRGVSERSSNNTGTHEANKTSAGQEIKSISTKFGTNVLAAARRQ